MLIFYYEQRLRNNIDSFVDIIASFRYKKKNDVLKLVDLAKNTVKNWTA